MNNEAREILGSQKELVLKTIKERKVREKRLKEEKEKAEINELYQAAKYNSDMINERFLERMLNTFIKDGTDNKISMKQYVGSYMFQYLKAKEIDEDYLSKYTEYFQRKGLIEEGEILLMFTDKINNKLQQYPFFFNKELYDSLGIYREIDYNSSLGIDHYFVVKNGDILRKKLQSVLTSVNLPKTKYSKIIQEKALLLQNIESATNDYEEMIERNANIIYLDLYRKLVDTYVNNCNANNYDIKTYRISLKCIYADEISKNDIDETSYNIIQAYRKYKHPQELICVEHNNGNEIVYLPLEFSKLWLLYNHPFGEALPINYNHEIYIELLTEEIEKMILGEKEYNQANRM